MAWIEVHQTLKDHRKTLEAADILEINPAHMMGHLVSLWLWALDNTPDGNVGEISPRTIARAAQWEGDAKEFVNALIKMKWLDQTEDALMIHDWFDYVGKLIDQRITQDDYRKRQNALYSDLRLIKAVRARDGDICQYCGQSVNWKDRKGQGGGTYDIVEPSGNNEVSNIVVCCRHCYSKKSGKTPKESGMYPNLKSNLPADRFMVDSGRSMVGKRLKKSVITVPYTTVPNNKPPIVPQGWASVEQQDENLKVEKAGGADREMSVDQSMTLVEKRFIEFWAAYPKKTGKGAAEKLWGKIKPSAELHIAILAAIEKAKQCEQWRKENGRFIPNPTTWLNQKRWEDEYDPAPQATAAPQPVSRFVNYKQRKNNYEELESLEREKLRLDLQKHHTT